MKGWGECLVGNTLIPTSKGFLSIEDIIQSQNELIASPFGVDKPIGYFETDSRKIHRIETVHGYTLEGTQDQEVLTLNSSTGYLEWKELRNLQIGDYIALDRKTSIWAENVPTFSTIKFKAAKPPTQLTKELARLLGYITRDDSSMFFYTSESEYVQKDFAYCAKACFPNCEVTLDSQITENGTLVYSARIHGDNIEGLRKEIREFLNYLGINYGDNARNKIPWCILQAPKEYMVEYLKALFECGGYANPDVIEYYTASPELVKQLKIVLLNFGIVTGGYIKKGRWNPFSKKFDKNVYKCKLLIRGAWLDIFYKFIGFISPKNRYKFKCRNTNIDIIPNVKQVITKIAYSIRTRIGYYKIDGEEKRLRIVGHTRAKNFTYDYLKKHTYIESDIRVVDSKLADTLKFCLDNEPFWELVKLNFIKKDKEKTYDFSMPSKSFVGNGVICHNCDALDLKAFAMNPKTRKLYQVTLTDRCEDRIIELMGSDSVCRKKLLGI